MMNSIYSLNDWSRGDILHLILAGTVRKVHLEKGYVTAVQGKNISYFVCVQLYVYSQHWKSI